MKFIYMADTHFGGSDDCGYRQQNRYLLHARELIAALNEWIRKDGGADFIVHGGDMVEAGTEENIAAAAELMAGLDLPVYLALGNHDLTEPDSYQAWLRCAPQFFGGGSGNFSIVRGPVELDILCAHWGAVPYLWVREEEQIPYFDRFQMAQLARESSGTRIIVSHAPPCGMPGPQAGLENELHPPAGDFPETVKDISRRYRPALFLGAHNHMNLLVHREGAWLATVSAYTETPFEFKVVEIGEDGTLHMKTVGLASAVGFRTDYDFGKTYIQGRPCDRSF